jgi:hypothetical protein
LATVKKITETNTKYDGAAEAFKAQSLWKYLRIQSLLQRKHNTSPLQRSNG